MAENTSADVYASRCAQELAGDDAEQCVILAVGSGVPTDVWRVWRTTYVDGDFTTYCWHVVYGAGPSAIFFEKRFTVGEFPKVVQFNVPAHVEDTAAGNYLNREFKLGSAKACRKASVSIVKTLFMFMEEGTSDEPGSQIHDIETGSRICFPAPGICKTIVADLIYLESISKKDFGAPEPRVI
jgi:hypothetical protein